MNKKNQYLKFTLVATVILIAFILGISQAVEQISKDGSRLDMSEATHSQRGSTTQDTKSTEQLKLSGQILGQIPPTHMAHMSDKNDEAQVEQHMKTWADQMALPAELKRYKELEGLAVRTRHEKAEFEKILSNKVIIDKSISRLINVPMNFSPKNEFERMRSVDFLQDVYLSAVERSDKATIRKIADYLDEDQILQIKDLRQKKSVAGDKLEIYQTVLKNQPELASKILKQTKSKTNQNIFRFAKNSI